MYHFRRKPPSSATPANTPPPTPTSISPIEFIKKEIIRARSKAKDPNAAAQPSNPLASSIGSPVYNPSYPGLNEPGTSKESGWRTAYGMARMAVEVTKESSDMFLPLKAVVGALSVLIKNYDQTTANAEQIGDIEERIQSLAEILASPVDDQDSEEKVRREALRKKLVRIIVRLGPLSEQHGLLRFLKNVDHANTLNGFVQDLACAVTDYQTSIQQSIHKTTKTIDENTKRVAKINEGIEKIDESTKKIDESTRNIIEAADLELLGKLDPVHNAGHQAGHHDTCLRGTRESILNGIVRWAEDHQDRHVFWLNGLAGTGKSTIAQTFAEMVANNGTLGASFFCSRDYLDRKELKNIFPTLAYQLACRYPAFRTQIIRIIKRDPSVARNSLISQLKDLVADPLSSTEISCVIVVDALDECVDDQPVSAILSVLGRFVKHLPFVKFFITGRPEPRIRTGFRLPLLEPFTQIFLLHEVELSSVDGDIRLYLQEKLAAVAKRRSDFDLTDPWPCDEDLTTLTKKSSGLFIFASTLAKFIESEHHEPNERLQLIVARSDSTVHEGRAGIDPLYVHVLVRGFSEVNEDSVFANLRRVLGAVILAFNPLSRAQVAKILKVKPSLITANLRHLHSVLLVPSEDSKEIRVFHKSFLDFLQDPERCSDPRFFISSPLYHADMALGCLELLKKLKRNPCDLPDLAMNRDVSDIPELLEHRVGGGSRYACAHWAMHIRSSPTDNDYSIRLINSAIEFLKENALPWIEVMSLENRLEDAVHNINSLLDWLSTVNAFSSGLDTLARDCLRFTMHFFHPIQQAAQHVYHSALPLSPKSSTFSSISLPENTRIAEFYGRPDNWGCVLRTITGVPVDFTCMTIIGNGSAARIATACDDGTVGIYDSVTGVLRLCLYPPDPIQMMTGSPDGSALFCTHRENPSITLWDIQTGGLIHTFTLTMEAKDTAISVNGRYLACGLSDGIVNVWEVRNRMEYPAFESGSPITCLCWLEPEERLMIANEASVHIRDIVPGAALVRSFDLQGPVCGAAFSQKSNQLAVVTSSGVWSSVTIINVQTSSLSDSCMFRHRLSYLAFSQTTGELVCGTETRGLETVNTSTWRWTSFDFLTGIRSVSTLSNGTVVANVAGSGVQLLSLDKGYLPPEQPIPPALTVHPLDRGKILAIIPADRTSVILLETATMQEVFTIRSHKNRPVPTDRSVILCASLENEIAVYCFEDGGKEYLQLWESLSYRPRWTVKGNELPSAGSFNLPACTRLVTFHDVHSQSHVRVRDMANGRLLAELSLDDPWAAYPLDITSDLEDQFDVHYNAFYITYVVAILPQSDTHSIKPLRKVASGEQVHEEQYYVDESREWIVSGPQKVCWIPVAYTRGAQESYCWIGSSLFMVGQDGVLRKLTFRGFSS